MIHHTLKYDLELEPWHVLYRLDEIAVTVGQYYVDICHTVVRRLFTIRERAKLKYMYVENQCHNQTKR